MRIETARLILRRWRDSDLIPFAAMNADPRVMEFFASVLTTEAAGAAIRFGFEQVGLQEILAFTAVGNVRSRRVMDKLGMVHDPGADFDHPDVPEGSPVRRHVLYRIRRPDSLISPHQSG